LKNVVSRSIALQSDERSDLPRRFVGAGLCFCVANAAVPRSLRPIDLVTDHASDRMVAVVEVAGDGNEGVTQVVEADLYPSGMFRGLPQMAQLSEVLAV
jgi:hypothetical protein